LKQTSKSPYITNPNRLADVNSAIQVMGVYKFYKLDFKGWADRITGDEKQAEYWEKIFGQHPEFFRLDAERKKASLVWRRNYPKRFDVDKEQKITKEEFYKLTDEQKARISRDPLTNSDISTLINTAINLHSRALEYKKDKRWWIAGIMGIIGVVIAYLLAALLGLN